MDDPLNPHSANARIPARSRRQAMDWSLALVSQGIETVIAPPSNDGQWALLVRAEDSERAFRTLRQYHAENRGWPWRHEVPWTRTHFDWGCIIWAALLVLVYFFGSRNTIWVNAGVMDSARVMTGEWWRVFTAMMLHADLAHLAENLSIGVVLFGLAMGRFGTGTGLFAAYLAGAAGNLASLLLNHKPFQGLGASGMVMGALGLLAVQAFSRDERRNTQWKPALVGGAAGVMIFVLFGLTPGTDMMAHLGGFLAGAILGSLLVFAPKRFMENFWVNLVTGLAMAGMVSMTWWLALSHVAK